MYYKEPLSPAEYRQGLEVGDNAIFFFTGEMYGIHSWEKIPVEIVIARFDYPFIYDTTGLGWHYSRFVRKLPKQLSLF